MSTVISLTTMMTAAGARAEEAAVANEASLATGGIVAPTPPSRVDPCEVTSEIISHFSPDQLRRQASHTVHYGPFERHNNGLYDPRGGANRYFPACAICHAPSRECTGNHPGIIELNMPCVMSTDMARVLKLLQTSCVHCSADLMLTGSYTNEIDVLIGVPSEAPLPRDFFTPDLRRHIRRAYGIRLTDDVLARTRPDAVSSHARPFDRALMDERDQMHRNAVHLFQQQDLYRAKLHSLHVDDIAMVSRDALDAGGDGDDDDDNNNHDPDARHHHRGWCERNADWLHRLSAWDAQVSKSRNLAGATGAAAAALVPEPLPSQFQLMEEQLRGSARNDDLIRSLSLMNIGPTGPAVIAAARSAVDATGTSTGGGGGGVGGGSGPGSGSGSGGASVSTKINAVRAMLLVQTTLCTILARLDFLDAVMFMSPTNLVLAHRSLAREVHTRAMTLRGLECQKKHEQPRSTSHAPTVQARLSELRADIGATTVCLARARARLKDHSLHVLRAVRDCVRHARRTYERDLTASRIAGTTHAVPLPAQSESSSSSSSSSPSPPRAFRDLCIARMRALYGADFAHSNSLFAKAHRPSIAAHVHTRKRRNLQAVAPTLMDADDADDDAAAAAAERKEDNEDADESMADADEYGHWFDETADEEGLFLISKNTEPRFAARTHPHTGKPAFRMLSEYDLATHLISTSAGDKLDAALACGPDAYTRQVIELCTLDRSKVNVAGDASAPSSKAKTPLGKNRFAPSFAGVRAQSTASGSFHNDASPLLGGGGGGSANFYQAAPVVRCTLGAGGCGADQWRMSCMKKSPTQVTCDYASRYACAQHLHDTFARRSATHDAVTRRMAATSMQHGGGGTTTGTAGGGGAAANARAASTFEYFTHRMMTQLHFMSDAQLRRHGFNLELTHPASLVTPVHVVPMHHLRPFTEQTLHAPFLTRTYELALAQLEMQRRAIRAHFRAYHYGAVHDARFPLKEWTGIVALQNNIVGVLAHAIAPVLSTYVYQQKAVDCRVPLSEYRTSTTVDDDDDDDDASAAAAGAATTTADTATSVDASAAGTFLERVARAQHLTHMTFTRDDETFVVGLLSKCMTYTLHEKPFMFGGFNSSDVMSLLKGKYGAFQRLSLGKRVAHSFHITSVCGTHLSASDVGVDDAFLRSQVQYHTIATEYQLRFWQRVCTDMQCSRAALADRRRGILQRGARDGIAFSQADEAYDADMVHGDVYPVIGKALIGAADQATKQESVTLDRGDAFAMYAIPEDGGGGGGDGGDAFAALERRAYEATERGETLDAARVAQRRDIARVSASKLRVGMTIQVSIQPGALVLVNRAPVLHIFNQTTQRVRRSNAPFALATSPQQCHIKNQDFDGDKNGGFTVPEGAEPRSEMQRLLAPAHMHSNVQNNTNTHGLHADALAMAYLISRARLIIPTRAVRRLLRRVQQSRHDALHPPRPICAPLEPSQYTFDASTGRPDARATSVCLAQRANDLVPPGAQMHDGTHDAAFPVDASLPREHGYDERAKNFTLNRLRSMYTRDAPAPAFYDAFRTRMCDLASAHYDVAYWDAPQSPVRMVQHATRDAFLRAPVQRAYANPFAGATYRPPFLAHTELAHDVAHDMVLHLPPPTLPHLDAYNACDLLDVLWPRGFAFHVPGRLRIVDGCRASGVYEKAFMGVSSQSVWRALNATYDPVYVARVRDEMFFLLCDLVTYAGVSFRPAEFHLPARVHHDIGAAMRALRRTEREERDAVALAHKKRMAAFGARDTLGRLGATDVAIRAKYAPRPIRDLERAQHAQRAYEIDQETMLLIQTSRRTAMIEGKVGAWLRTHVETEVCARAWYAPDLLTEPRVREFVSDPVRARVIDADAARDLCATGAHGSPAASCDISTHRAALNMTGVLILSGTKGKVTDLVNIAKSIGMQSIEGHPIQPSFGGRLFCDAVAHDGTYPPTPEEAGYVFRSFTTGLVMNEWFAHAIISRDKLAASTKEISAPGDMANHLIACLIDKIQSFECEVHDEKRRVIQYVTACDLLNPEYTQRATFPIDAWRARALTATERRFFPDIVAWACAVYRSTRGTGGGDEDSNNNDDTNDVGFHAFPLPAEAVAAAAALPSDPETVAAYRRVWSQFCVDTLGCADASAHGGDAVERRAFMRMCECAVARWRQQHADPTFEARPFKTVFACDTLIEQCRVSVAHPTHLLVPPTYDDSDDSDLEPVAVDDASAWRAMCQNPGGADVVTREMRANCMMKHDRLLRRVQRADADADADDAADEPLTARYIERRVAGLSRYMRKLTRACECIFGAAQHPMYMQEWYVRECLTPHRLLRVERLTRVQFKHLMRRLFRAVRKGLLVPGTNVGGLVAGAASETLIQLLLRVFHAVSATKVHDEYGVRAMRRYIRLTKNPAPVLTTALAHPTVRERIMPSASGVMRTVRAESTSNARVSSALCVKNVADLVEEMATVHAPCWVPQPGALRRYSVQRVHDVAAFGGIVGRVYETEELPNEYLHFVYLQRHFHVPHDAVRFVVRASVLAANGIAPIPFLRLFRQRLLNVFKVEVWRHQHADSTASSSSSSSSSSSAPKLRAGSDTTYVVYVRLLTPRQTPPPELQYHARLHGDGFDRVDASATTTTTPTRLHTVQAAQSDDDVRSAQDSSLVRVAFADDAVNNANQAASAAAAVRAARPKKPTRTEAERKEHQRAMRARTNTAKACKEQLKRLSELEQAATGAKKTGATAHAFELHTTPLALPISDKRGKKRKTNEASVTASASASASAESGRGNPKKAKTPTKKKKKPIRVLTSVAVQSMDTDTDHPDAVDEDTTTAAAAAENVNAVQAATDSSSSDRLRRRTETTHEQQSTPQQQQQQPPSQIHVARQPFASGLVGAREHFLCSEHVPRSVGLDTQQVHTKRMRIVHDSDTFAQTVVVHTLRAILPHTDILRCEITPSDTSPWLTYDEASPDAYAVASRARDQGLPRARVCGTDRHATIAFALTGKVSLAKLRLILARPDIDARHMLINDPCTAFALGGITCMRNMQLVHIDRTIAPSTPIDQMCTSLIADFQTYRGTPTRMTRAGLVKTGQAYNSLSGFSRSGMPTLVDAGHAGTTARNDTYVSCLSIGKQPPHGTNYSRVIQTRESERAESQSSSTGNTADDATMRASPEAVERAHNQRRTKTLNLLRDALDVVYGERTL